MSLIKDIVIKIIGGILLKADLVALTIKSKSFRHLLGYIDKTASLTVPDVCTCPSKIYMYEHTSILGGSKFIISQKGDNGMFIMKKYSGAAQGLTVITGNHDVTPSIGKWRRENLNKRIGDYNKNIIVEEDVWIGTNVTLLSGSILGRGSIIGAGSVVRNSIPPYSIVMGNPAKIVGFVLSPKEVAEHELTLYNEKERLSIDRMTFFYKNFFLNRIQEIRSFLDNKS